MTVVVKVEWEDIVQKCCAELESVQPAKCVTYGELESEDSEMVVIVMERMAEVITRQVFPTGCVKSITRFKEG